ncbi:hypothetical protein ACR9GP_24590 [Enterobacter ludwigii]
MNEQDLLEMIRCFGRCEVVYLEEKGFLAVPIPEGAQLVTKEAHEENQLFFRNVDS